VPACIWCFFSTPCRVTWSIEGGDEFGYENVITTHFASAEERPRANNGMQRTAPGAAADAERLGMSFSGVERRYASNNGHWENSV
jgi:hypothetical protein